MDLEIESIKPANIWFGQRCDCCGDFAERRSGLLRQQPKRRRTTITLDAGVFKLEPGLFSSRRFVCMECEKLPRASLPHPNPAILEALQRLLEFLHIIYTFLRQLLDELTYTTRLWDLCSEFPQNIRHPCTTMPWTIWPALVVLWGVCWMFYSSSEADLYRANEESPSLAFPADFEQWFDPSMAEADGNLPRPSG